MAVAEPSSAGGLRHPLAWALFAVLALAVPGLALVLQEQAPEPPPVMGELPDFSLVDQAGRPLDRGDLAGKVVVLDFIFTRCPDICPTLTSQMAAVRNTLGPAPFDGPPLHLVSVSVDPSHDTPAVLADYAGRYSADLDGWSFLTGPAEDVDALVAGLNQALERGAPEEAGGAPSILHSQRLLLIDPTGQVRGFHEIDEEGLAALVQDIEAIAAEAPPRG